MKSRVVREEAIRKRESGGWRKRTATGREGGQKRMHARRGSATRDTAAVSGGVCEGAPVRMCACRQRREVNRFLKGEKKTSATGRADAHVAEVPTSKGKTRKKEQREKEEGKWGEKATRAMCHQSQSCRRAHHTAHTQQRTNNDDEGGGEAGHRHTGGGARTAGQRGGEGKTKKLEVRVCR